MLRTSEKASMFGVTCALLGAGFLLAGLRHVGGFPIGPLVDEPRIDVLAIMELASGAVLCAAAVGLFGRTLWAYKTAVLGHVLGIVTCLIGLLAPRLDLGEMTQFDTGYYVLILALVCLDLVALWRTRPRNPLKRAAHEVAAKLY